MIRKPNLLHPSFSRPELRRPGLLLCCLSIVAFTASLPKSVLAGPRFSRNAANASLWQRVYDQIPEVWKTDRVLVVRELTEWQMDRLVEDSGGDKDPHNADTVVDGCYQRCETDDDVYGTISLRETLHGDLAAFVFAHEYGHYVWDDILSAEERATYTRVWRAQKRAGHLVTDYAAENVDEGFAEAFAHFLRKPALLRRRDPRSATFMADLLARARQRQAAQG
jgi:predicted metalloprotease